MFLDAHSFPRATLWENCSLLGTDNVRGQISVHVFARNGDYCLYNPRFRRYLSSQLENFNFSSLLFHTEKKTNFCKKKKKQKSQQNMLSTSLMAKKVTSTLTDLVLRKVKLSHFIK